jgi:Xaa-Pro aminopeptidase
LYLWTRVIPFYIERNTERAQNEAPFPIITVKSDKEIRAIPNNMKILKDIAGLELDVLPVSVFEKIRQVIGFERYADVAPCVKEMRAIKSLFEIEQIKKSGKMVSHVFSKARQIIRKGVA